MLCKTPISMLIVLLALRGQPAPPPSPPPGGSGISPGAALAIALGSAVAGGLAGRAMTKPEDVAKALDRRGPRLADHFTMSALTVRGFVKGNWPAVVEYTVGQGTMVILSVTADTGVDAWYLLPPGPGRVQVRLQLDERFGDRPAPAFYSLRALSSVAPPVQAQGAVPARPMPLRVHGIGAGDRAVGSVGIDQVRIGPAAIRPKQKETGQYGFRCHKGFDKMAAEFMKIGKNGGFIDATKSQEEKLDGVRANQTVSQLKWKPRNGLVGAHFLQVRGWMGRKEGDWVIAWSDDEVMVSE